MRLVSISLLLVLTGCGLQLPQFGGRAGPPLPTSTVQVAGEDTPRPAVRPVDDAAATPQSEVPGTTLATLGDASVAGLWLETPLVDVPGPGRVTTSDGTSLDLQLIPSGGVDGAGSRLSLAAMQALGLPLTAIAELSVDIL